jgi:uncharacterized membrane protein YcaP (DUF421 family)
MPIGEPRPPSSASAADGPRAGLMGMHLLATAINHDLFDIGVPIIEKVLRTAAVYFGLVVLLRIGGKRDLAQLNSFDLVVLLLLSNVVQNAVIGPDDSLIGGLLGAATLVALNGLVVRSTSRNDKLFQWFEGSPTVLASDGKLNERAIRDLGLRRPDVIVALRRQGADMVSEVEQAVLEPGGAIVVTFKAEDMDASKGDLVRVERKLDELMRRIGAGGEPA